MTDETDETARPTSSGSTGLPYFTTPQRERLQKEAKKSGVPGLLRQASSSSSSAVQPPELLFNGGPLSRDKSRTPSARPASGSESISTAELERLGHWKVKEIEDKKLENYDGYMQMMYLVFWEGWVRCDEGVGRNPTWEADDEINARHLIKEFEDSHADSIPSSSALDPRAYGTSKYVRASLAGYFDVAEQVWLEETTVPNSKLESHMHSWGYARKIMVNILASLDKPLFHALLRGNLQRSSFVEKEVRDRLANNVDPATYYHTTDSKGKANRPCIYLFLFTDEKGYHPRVTDAFDMLDTLEQYMADNDFAREFDLRFDGEPNDTDYDAGDRPDKKLSSAHGRVVIAQFLESSRKYLSKFAPESRMPETYSEVGYTIDPYARLMQHYSYHSSNYLMVIMDRISRNDFRGKWRFRGEVIFLCFERTHAMVAEIMFTACLGAKHTSGHGCSHAKAGLSTRSSSLIDSATLWDIYTAEALDNTDLEKNLKDEFARCKRIKASDKELKRKNKILKKEVDRLKLIKEFAELAVLNADVRRLRIFASFVQDCVENDPALLKVALDRPASEFSPKEPRHFQYGYPLAEYWFETLRVLQPHAMHCRLTRYIRTLAEAVIHNRDEQFWTTLEDIWGARERIEPGWKRPEWKRPGIQPGFGGGAVVGEDGRSDGEDDSDNDKMDSDPLQQKLSAFKRSQQEPEVRDSQDQTNDSESDVDDEIGGDNLAMMSGGLGGGQPNADTDDDFIRDVSGGHRIKARGTGSKMRRTDEQIARDLQQEEFRSNPFQQRSAEGEAYDSQAFSDGQIAEVTARLAGGIPFADQTQPPDHEDEAGETYGA